MSSGAAGNLLVVQSGGPTAVFNASLYGVIDEARRQGGFGQILGARAGLMGLYKNEFIDLASISEDALQKLRTSPGASLGSARYELQDSQVEQIVADLHARNVRHAVIIGGNGSMRAAEILTRSAQAVGHDLNFIGVPKTVDNDIPLTDRCPGFGSAARYVAQSVRDLGMDVRTMPQPVSIFETMGRDVGWLAGASVLAKIDDNHAPHLVYLPETPFDTDRFLADVERVVGRIGWAVVVVAEGLVNAAGQPVYQTESPSQRDALDRPLAGGVAAHLAEIVTGRLDLRCRWEKPGLCARASALHVSDVDREDAERVGRAGIRAVLSGKRSEMVTLRPLKNGAAECGTVPLALVTGKRGVPAEWRDDASDMRVTSGFVEYVRGIVGELVDYPVPLKDQLTGNPPRQGQSV